MNAYHIIIPYLLSDLPDLIGDEEKPLPYDCLSNADLACYKNETCAICLEPLQQEISIWQLMNPFGQDKRIIGHRRLPNDKAKTPEKIHCLHVECLHNLLKSNQNQCPSCRVLIKKGEYSLIDQIFSLSLGTGVAVGWKIT